MRLIDSSVDTALVFLNYTIPGYGQVLSAPMAVVDELQKSQLQYSIVYGTGMGASLILLFLVWLLCSRKTPLFVMNNATLVTYVITASLNLAYITGPLLSMSMFFTGMVSSNSAINTVLTTNAFQVILVFLVQTTMVYHVYVIFKSHKSQLRRHLIVGFLCILEAVTIAFYINSNVRYARRLDMMYTNGKTFRDGTIYDTLPFILFQCSVNVSSIVLFFKLVLAIRTRRYLGLKQFGVFHILMIASTQTMLIPSILVIINYATHSAHQTNLLSTISMMFVVLSLPASSMWAAATNTASIPSSAASSLFSFPSSKDYSDEKPSQYVARNWQQQDNILPVTLVHNRLTEESVDLPKELADLIERTSIV